ncbi:MAG: hypothetical protein ACLVB5_14265 [Christensenellales bacterium]
MVRVLRYPYLTGAACLCAISCAVARDLCVGKGLLGWSRVLLICTFVLLGLMLLRCSPAASSRMNWAWAWAFCCASAARRGTSWPPSAC